MFHFINQVEDGLSTQSVELGEDWGDDSDAADFDIDIDLHCLETATPQREEASDA